MKWETLFSLPLLFPSTIKSFLHLQSLLNVIPGISENHSALKHSQFLNLIKKPLAAKMCRSETVI